MGKKDNGYIVNNKKSGEWIEWYSNGQKKYIGNFLNGNRHGSWVEWDESGNEIIDGEYKSVKNGMDNLEAKIMSADY